MVTDVWTHPAVHAIRRERDALARRNAYLEDVLRGYLARDLSARTLEPLNPCPPGVLAPPFGGLLTIHVDALRYRANRILQTRDPVIRILDGDEVRHSHALRLTGSSWMGEDYDRPAPGRSSAVCVLQTADPVEVLR